MPSRLSLATRSRYRPFMEQLERRDLLDAGGPASSLRTMLGDFATTQLGHATTASPVVLAAFDQQAIRVPGTMGQKVKTTFTYDARTTALSTEMGLFRVDDASGRIGALQPGDPGYARAALRDKSRKVVFAKGQGPRTTFKVDLIGGRFYGLYLVQKGTTSEFLKKNPTNQTTKKPVAFFSFAAANPDGLAHVRWENPVSFAWEDQLNGGDGDFNDLVGRVAFKGFPNDTTPPALQAGLKNDTGASSTDFVTSDPTVRGAVTDLNQITGLVASVDNATEAGFRNVLARLQPNGSFELPRSVLEQVRGSTLADGFHTVRMQATDAWGNVSPVTSFTFFLDTIAPRTPTIGLDDASDTGQKGDGKTSLGTVTLRGTTTPREQVQLVGNVGIALFNPITADDFGNFAFTGVVLNPGRNDFTVQAFDLAGNQSSTPLTITYDALPTVASISPAHGEEMVSLTRETIVRFSERIDPATITADSIYLIANGERVPIKPPRVSPTELFATVFYQNPLPSSTAVRVVVDGNLIRGRDGQLLDADGDGQPGGWGRRTFGPCR